MIEPDEFSHNNRQGMLQDEQFGSHDNVKNIKTPRRGLGMIVNGSKTPCSERRDFAVMKSAVKQKQQEFDVFEDTEEPELKRLSLPDLEEKIVDAEIERVSSPIERVSRMPYRRDSLESLHRQKLAELDDVVLSESVLEEPSNLHSSTLSEAEALAYFGVEDWDEYPPIEKASRIEEHPNFFVIEDKSGEYVDLVDDQSYSGFQADGFELVDELSGAEYGDLDDWLEEKAANLFNSTN